MGALAEPGQLEAYLAKTPWSRIRLVLFFRSLGTRDGGGGGGGVGGTPNRTILYSSVFFKLEQNWVPGGGIRPHDEKSRNLKSSLTSAIRHTGPGRDNTSTSLVSPAFAHPRARALPRDT